MKKILMGVLLLSSFPIYAQSVSYNIVYMSDYWYRGVFQYESSVNFGADVDTGSFYAGTWMADVDQGIEMDVYAGTTFTILGFDSLALGREQPKNIIDKSTRNLILILKKFIF